MIKTYCTCTSAMNDKNVLYLYSRSPGQIQDVAMLVLVLQHSSKQSSTEQRLDRGDNDIVTTLFYSTNDNDDISIGMK